MVDEFDEMLKEYVKSKNGDSVKSKDLLKRDVVVNDICDIIRERRASRLGAAIALDGEWGCGKTFILRQIEEKLKNEFLIFHYDSWENDFYEEPLVGILTVFANSLNKKERDNPDVQRKKYYKAMRKVFSLVAKGLVKKYTSIDINAINSAIGDVKTIYGEPYIDLKAFNSFLGVRETIDRVNDMLCSYMAYEHKYILFVVDELDRCLPNYALKVLNRLHHICADAPIIQLLAMNKKELYGNICDAFGRSKNDESFFAEKYLDRFVTSTYKIDNGFIASNLIEPWEKLAGNIDEAVVSKQFAQVFCHSVLSQIPIREWKRIIDKVCLLHNRIVNIIGDDVKISLALLCAELMEFLNRLYYKKEYIWNFEWYPEMDYNEEVDEHYETGNYFYTMIVVNYKKDDDWKYKSFVESVARLLSSPYRKPEDGNCFHIELNKEADCIKALFAKPSDYPDHEHFVFDSDNDVYKADSRILASFVVDLRKIV